MDHFAIFREYDRVWDCINFVLHDNRRIFAYQELIFSDVALHEELNR